MRLVNSGCFDAIITPNYSGWLVNALFGLKPTHGDEATTTTGRATMENR